jgi:hypothetical protein
MTDEEVAAVAAGLTGVQREAIRRSVSFSTGRISLTDWQEDSWDITEGLSESIANPVCGELTPLGLRIRAHLQDNQPHDRAGEDRGGGEGYSPCERR